MEKMITAAEVASLIRVHVRTVYRLAEKGILPGNKIGRGWRFSKGSILALVAGGTSAGSEAEGESLLFPGRRAATE